MVRTLVASVALFVAPTWVWAHSQSQDPAAASAPPSSSPATPAAKPKKVWTNENLGDVSGTISVVGDPRRPSASASSGQAARPGQNKSAATKTSDDSVDPKTVAQVREQLQKLQAGIDSVDKQLAQLTGLSKGDSKNTGGLKSDTFSYSTASVEDQIKQLQAKRNQLQTAMDGLLDAARASGIEPGQLR
ncbi:MAG TPA: hypothetical protein VGG58_00865 [Candidatus Acidoferrum sp.]|jgi:hypothetical protein